MLFLLDKFIAIACDAFIVLLSFMNEGGLYFGIDGSILLHELVYLSDIDLPFNVLEHHLIVAQLDNKLAVQILQSSILLL